MAFEFTSSAVSIARQHQLWGLLIGAAGLGITAYALARGKPHALGLAGLGLMAVGGWYLFQSWQLASVGGEWEIRVDEQSFSWQSPAESLDPSFAVAVSDIDYLDRSAMRTRGDERPLYHLIMRDKTAIHLNPMSGVDFAALSRHLATLQIETRQTDRFHLPVELRAK